ncbi:MAG: hypothetical protein IKV65_05620, partial [Erysipelotrichaceae bacterium]|nr:hypothetical protein [Erysipelotrichaceae bacterium]
MNKYSAAPVTFADYDLKITKNLSDTNFTSDKVVFTFKLQQLNADNQYVDVMNGSTPAEYTVEFTKGESNHTKNIMQDLSFTFTQPGTYSYRIVEVPSQAYPGIIYDPVECFFTIEVKDDGNGQLVVNGVYAGTDTTISGNVISTTFNNQFIITGAAEVVLNISKTMNDFGTGANIPLSDFEFTVHEVATADGTADNSNIIATLKSNGEGHAVFSRVFSQSLDEAYKLKTHYYVIKEVNKGNMSYPGTVGYDTTEYRVTVEAGSTSTSTSGVVSPTMIVYVNGQQVYPTSSSISTAAEGDNILIANVGLSFANTYTPNSVHLTIPVSGIKTLKGYPDGVNLPEFTFIISKSDENGNVIDNTSLTKTVQGSGTFVFTDLVDDPLTAENEATALFSYNKTGNYYYVVEETAGTNAGIAYDSTKYLVTVSVTSDHLGGLTATMTKVQDLLAAGAPEAVIEFVNTYTVDNAEVVLKGKKTLVSDLWTLNPNTFSFNLYETTDTFDTTGLTPFQTTTNGLGNDTGAFQFALNYGEAGKHYYVIEEVVPSGIDSNNKLNGITYDVAKYQVTVDVKDQGTGELSTTVTGLDSNNLASFTNKYDVASTTAIIKGSKHIDGALLDALYQGTEFFNF